MPVVNILLPVAPDHTRLTKVVAALISSPRQQIITKIMVFPICHFVLTEILTLFFVWLRHLTFYRQS